MRIPVDRVRIIPFFRDLVQEHLREFNTMLDVGCGATHKEWKKIYGDKYKGLDVFEKFNSDYVGDGCDLSRFESNSHDIVCSWSTIEHVTHPYSMLSEMKRVSRGTVLFTTDYTERDKNKSSNHLYSWTEKTLGQLLAKIHKDSRVYVAKNMLIGVMYNCAT